jgi:hypothetical protein
VILRIDDDVKNTPGVMYIPYGWLDNKAVHLFIASNKWEKVVVVLSDSIPENLLKYIILSGTTKEVIINDEHPSPKCIRLLCEIYPEKSGMIRKADMLGRDMRYVLV